MAIIDELIAILGFKVEGVDKVKEFQTGLDQAERGANRATSAISGTAKAIGIGLSGAAAVAFGKQALTHFASFELAMTRIGVNAGATALEVTGAANEVQRLASRFALPIDQATAALATLTASGMDLQQAMAFLPSVLATAQASGAATEDIANSIQKVSLSLGITAQDAQKAFDIMVAGGKAGQFELRDMAQYIPELSNAFGTLGYSGDEGLRKLVVLMQTLRERTGSSSAAATQLSNILGKIYSDQTAKNFADFGINLEEEMKKARAAGEDTITAFTRLSNLAIGGDLTKLGKLFTDQEFRLGMTSLMTGADSMERLSAALKNVDGSTMKDLEVVLAGTEAKLQRLTNSYDRFMNAAGGALADPVGGVLDAVSSDLDYGDAMRSALEKQGMGYLARENWIFWHGWADKDRMARRGGFKGELSTPRSQQIEYQSVPDTTMADIDALRAKLDASLDRIQGPGAAAPVVTDNRQDNRSTTVNITQNVTQASDAPRAAAEATGRAVAAAGMASSSIATPARIAAEPSSSGWGGPR